MKRLLPIVTLVVLVSLPVVAGEIQEPGKQPTPPAPTNQSTTLTELGLFLLSMILK